MFFQAILIIRGILSFRLKIGGVRPKCNECYTLFGFFGGFLAKNKLLAHNNTKIQ